MAPEQMADENEAALQIEVGLPQPPWTADRRIKPVQSLLYVHDRYALLLIFQVMDAGKDSPIKHVMSDVNPQGCRVYSLKHPSAEELDHDFLCWTTRCFPQRGRIGIFNRSCYEEVLIVRVHSEILRAETLSRAGEVRRRLRRKVDAVIS